MKKASFLINKERLFGILWSWKAVLVIKLIIINKKTKPTFKNFLDKRKINFILKKFLNQKRKKK